MIAPLRRRHFHMTLGLAVVVPPLVAWSLIARPEPPVTAPLPAALAGPNVGSLAAGAEADAHSFIGAPVVAEVSAARDGRRQLVVHATSPLEAPDPLLYWSAPTTLDALPERLPEGARLLGPWDGRPARFEVPAEAGTVWLYALGHQRVVGALALPAGGGER